MNKHVTGWVVKRLLVNKNHDQFISLALRRMFIREMFVVKSGIHWPGTLTCFREQFCRLATEFIEAMLMLWIMTPLLERWTWLPRSRNVAVFLVVSIRFNKIWERNYGSRRFLGRGMFLILSTGQLCDLAWYFVPYLFSLLFLTCIHLSSQCAVSLLRNAPEEKDELTYRNATTFGLPIFAL